jgi:hypothetical protein
VTQHIIGKEVGEKRLKYENSMVVFNQPHVIVFANFPHNETSCSVDRWISVEITP